MWFPTKTQEMIEFNLAVIEKYFIEYYGEKYKDKIEKKFKEFIFVVVHDNLESEKIFIEHIESKIINKHLKLFLDKLGIKENFTDFVLVDIYKHLVNNNIDFLIDNIEKISKKKVNKLLFLLNFKTHIKDNKKMISDIEKEISEISGRYDFIQIRETIKKFQYDYLKEISSFLSDSQKQILEDQNKNLDYKIDKLWDYLPNISFEYSILETSYKIQELALTVEGINKIKNTRFKFKDKIIKYMDDVYKNYLKEKLPLKEINIENMLLDKKYSNCKFHEIESENKKRLFSIITYQLPLSDCTCIHELNHHIESYINLKGQGICGWLPVRGQYLDKKNNCSLLFDEIINDFIAQDIVRLMHTNGKYILDKKEKSDSDYQLVGSLLENFFNEFRDIIIESRIGENPSILYDKLGEENLKKLNNLFKEIESHNDYPYNIKVEFLEYYKKKIDDILQKMIEYKTKKFI